MAAAVSLAGPVHLRFEGVILVEVDSHFHAAKIGDFPNSEIAMPKGDCNGSAATIGPSGRIVQLVEHFAGFGDVENALVFAIFVIIDVD